MTKRAMTLHGAGRCNLTARAAKQLMAAWPGVQAAILAIALAGCLANMPTSPRPDTVYVPHPDNAPLDRTAEELLEQYAASPNRNPDGLGVLPTVWLQSRMMLVLPQVKADQERRNKLAYARTDAEQIAVLRKHEQFFRDFIQFDGWLIGDLVEPVRPEWYLPEGIYLIDDRGRKFMPTSVGNQLDPAYYRMIHNLRTYQDKNAVPEAYPRIVFPRAAITPETKAITLYFAGLYRRMSFTWVFDPDYVPDRPQYSTERAGVEGLWRR